MSEALRKVSEVKLDKLPRMADFALFGTAAFGDEFIERYRALRGEANKSAIKASIVGTLVTRLMEKQSTWEGTASELLSCFETLADHRMSNSNVNTG